MRFACPLPRLWLPRLVAALATLCAYAAHAEPATFLVGADATCDFATVQQAVNAAATNPGPDTIHIATNQNYNAQGIDIGAQDLDIIGGFASCAATTPTGSTLLNGLGGSADSVFEVRGAGTRRFSRLAIANGDESNEGDGGGIDIKGKGVVELIETSIAGSKAGRGGGIYAESDGGPLVLELKTGTTVVNNTAVGSGGGLYVIGDVDVYIDEPQVLVASNRATNGQGGGLYLEGPVFVSLGSSGFNAQGVLSGNEAVVGGGMSLRANDDGGPTVVAAATDLTRPVRIEGNRATSLGGAMYGKGSVDSFGNFGKFFELRLDGFVIAGNEAADGGAFFLDNDSSTINGEAAGRVFSGSGNDASRCVPSIECNLIANNRATAADGAIVFGDPNARIGLGRVTLRGNQAAHLVRLEGSGGSGNDAAFSSAHAAIVDNVTTAELFRSTGPEDEIYLRLATIANNTVSAGELFRFSSASAKFNLTESIVFQPGIATLRHPGGPNDPDVVVARVVSNDVSTLPTADQVFVAPPRFTDPGRGDYRLQAASAAVDFAPATAAAERDLENQLRDRELVVKPNLSGPRDLGAYERQTIGNLIRNDSFLGDIRLWDLLEPAATTFNAASFDANGGSLQVSVPGPTTLQTITAARQCVNLPGPATYTLDGRGFGGQTNPINQDRLVLEWRLRFSSEDCGGPVDAGGELPILGASGWGAPAAPFVFQVSTAQWSPNTTLEVRLVVNRNPNDPVGNGLLGRFDALSLTVSGRDIFKDGFE